MTIEKYIAGFNSRHNKTSTIYLDNKLKGHLFSLQAALTEKHKNMLVGVASGMYGP